MTTEELCTTPRGQCFERRSITIPPEEMANHVMALANADGGVLVLGVEDDGTVTGIDGFPSQVDSLIKAPTRFGVPPLTVSSKTLSCKDRDGKANHLLVLIIPVSPDLIANRDDEVYYRMGDRSEKLSFEERFIMVYDKGIRYFEDEPVYGTSIDDIDRDFVEGYCKMIAFRGGAEAYLNRFVVKHDGREEMSGAAILLFGKYPERAFPRARVRFVRYDGTAAKVGREMNVIKDRIFTGKILDVTKQAIEFVESQIKEHSYLGPDGVFVTDKEYPDFVWKECIVNAIAHRNYSIKGTDIMIKMFDDHLSVESPGRFPSIVRPDNIRTTHFSRNPKITAFLRSYHYTGVPGEGMERMCKEMEQSGLPLPELRADTFLVHTTIRNKQYVKERTNRYVPS